MVRELNGVVSAQGAHGGFVVTGAEFSREAREISDACGIRRIDWAALEGLIGNSELESIVDSGVAVVADPKANVPAMRDGHDSADSEERSVCGSAVLGCGRYPKCMGDCADVLSLGGVSTKRRVSTERLSPVELYSHETNGPADEYYPWKGSTPAGAKLDCIRS